MLFRRRQTTPARSRSRRYFCLVCVDAVWTSLQTWPKWTWPSTWTRLNSVSSITAPRCVLLLDDICCWSAGCSLFLNLLTSIVLICNLYYNYKNICYLLWNRGAWRFFHDTYLTIEVQGIRCTNHLHDSCPFYWHKSTFYRSRMPISFQN